MGPAHDDDPGTAGPAETPPEEKGPWDRFVELRNESLARGVDIDRRLGHAVPVRPAQPVGRRSRDSAPGRNIFAVVLVAALAVSVVFLLVVALAG